MSGSPVHVRVNDEDTSVFVNGKQMSIEDVRWKFSKDGVFVPSENYDPLPTGETLTGIMNEASEMETSGPSRVLSSVMNLPSSVSDYVDRNDDDNDGGEEDEREEPRNEDEQIERMAEKVRDTMPGLGIKPVKPGQTSTAISASGADMRATTEKLNHLRFARTMFMQSLSLLEQNAKRLQGVTDPVAKEEGERKMKQYVTEVQGNYLKEVEKIEDELRRETMKNISQPEYMRYFGSSKTEMQQNVFHDILPPLFFVDVLDSEKDSTTKTFQQQKAFDTTFFETLSKLREFQVETSSALSESEKRAQRSVRTRRNRNPRWIQNDRYVTPDEEELHDIEGEGKNGFQNLWKLFSPLCFSYYSRHITEKMLRDENQEFSLNQDDDGNLYMFDLPVREDEKWFVLLIMRLVNCFGTAWIVKEDLKNVCDIIAK